MSVKNHYLERNIQKYITEIAPTGKRMPEAYIVQTLEKDQEKEIPWQSKVLYGLHHRQIAEIAILPVAAERRKTVIDSSAGASIKHQIY